MKTYKDIILTPENLTELNERSVQKYRAATTNDVEGAYFHTKQHWMPRIFFNQDQETLEAKFRDDIRNAEYDGLVNRKTITFTVLGIFQKHYAEGTPIKKVATQ